MREKEKSLKYRLIHTETSASTYLMSNKHIFYSFWNFPALTCQRTNSIKLYNFFIYQLHSLWKKKSCNITVLHLNLRCDFSHSVTFNKTISLSYEISLWLQFLKFVWFQHRWLKCSFFTWDLSHVMSIWVSKLLAICASWASCASWLGCQDLPEGTRLHLSTDYKNWTPHLGH